MNYSFIKKHKALSAFFVFGVLAIIGGLTIYQSNALSPNWTQTDWSGGQSHAVVVVNTDLGTSYKEATPHIDFSQEGKIGVSNIINNPGFENDILGWTWTEFTTATHETTTTHTGAGAIKLVISDSTPNFLYQDIDVRTSDNYYLSAYVKNETSGDGGIVNDTVISLFFNTGNIPTGYTDLGDGWYRIYSTGPIPDDGSGAKSYGVVTTANKTIYLDDFQLFPEYNVLTSNVFDMGNPKVWTQLGYSLTGTGTGTTTIKVRTGNEIDVDGNLIDAYDFVDPSCTNITSGTDPSISPCVFKGDRYIQYQILFTPSTIPEPQEYQTLESITIFAESSIIKFAAESSNAPEGDFPINIPVNLNRSLERAATVNYTITGTATNGEDYDPIPDTGTLTIPAGLSSGNITINLRGDSLDEEDETIIITLSDPTYAALDTPSVYTYTIIDDDDPPTVFWSVGDETVDETAGTLTMTAQLNGPSGKEITIPFNITGTAINGGVDFDYTLVPETPSPLTILPGLTTATFDININNDNLFEGLTPETIILTMDTGTIINATPHLTEPTEKTISINDDELQPELNFFQPDTSVWENSGDISIQIFLDKPSYEDIDVQYTLGLPDPNMSIPEDFELTGNCDEFYVCSLTIPAGSTEGYIPIRTTDDAIAEANETAIIEIAILPPSQASVGITNQHNLIIFDNDVPGISATLSTFYDYTTEWGGYQTFEIALNTQPDGTVVIDVASSDTSEGTVDTPTLTFDETDWDTPKYITITGVNDDIADSDIPYQISLTIDPISTTDTTGYGGLMPTIIDTTNMNDDVAGVFITPTELITYEYGVSDSFTVVLTSEPEGVVVIDLTNLGDTDINISTSQITFNSSNWDIEQEVTVTSINDSDQEPTETYVIRFETNDLLTTDPQYRPIVIPNVSVTNMDDDTPGITVFPLSGTTTEANGTTTFTVVLDSQPSDDVIIALESDNTTEGTVNPASLTFTNADWNTPKTVTVTGVDDDIDDGDIAYNIRGTVSSDDLNYHDFPFDIVRVTNEDDDTAGINISLISTDTNESNGTAIFTIQLESEPTHNVSFAISSSDTSEGTVSPENITFTPVDWHIAQVITVTGVDDYIVDGPQSYQIDISPAISLDPKYNNHFSSHISLQNIDNDSAGFTVTQSAGSTNVTEGSTTDTYTIRLNTIPSDDVVVTITPNAQITVIPTTLTFTTADWNINQTVTVTAVNDTIVEGNHTGTISHSVASADGAYNEFTISNILVAITDNDSAPSTGGGGGGGFWFPSHNPDETQPTPSQTQTDPQREQRLEKLRNLGIAIHSLVKIPDDGNPNTTFDSIVYYIGTDGKRHVFPNANIYKTWYDSFRYVKVYPLETLSQIPLGDNVRYRPGVKMIKFTSSNRVYAIEAGGKLRWILNEKVAWYMYGQGWQKHIVSLPDSLFPGYDFGNDISHSNQFDFAAEAAQSQNISMDLGL
jgi:hypothetical protein